MTTTDWVGTIGVATLLFAYFLNLKGIIKRDSLLYLALNFMGACIACLASVMLRYWPFIILEGCWAVVSVVELAMIFIKGEEKR